MASVVERRRHVDDELGERGAVHRRELHVVAVATVFDTRTACVSASTVAAPAAFERFAKMPTKSSVPFVSLPILVDLHAEAERLERAREVDGREAAADELLADAAEQARERAGHEGRIVDEEVAFVTLPFATLMSPMAGMMPPFGFVFGSLPVWRFTGIVRSAWNVKTRTKRSRCQR